MGKPENLQDIGWGNSGPQDDKDEAFETYVSSLIPDEIDVYIMSNAELVADNVFNAGFEGEAKDDLDHVMLSFVDAVRRGKSSVTLPISDEVAKALLQQLDKFARERIIEQLEAA